MAVHEVYPEVGACCCPPLKIPHRAPDGTGRSREGYPIDIGIRCDQWCRPLRGTLLSMPGMTMGILRPRRQLQLAVWIPKYLPMPPLKI